MKRLKVVMLCLLAGIMGAKAQIGYQVSLLNTATGEPRANVTVNATVTITNSKGESIYSGTQSATSNDFGVLSLTVGNTDTFKNVDFGKLPFFIEVSIDGQLIGKSQILNVPVAEAAKTLVLDLSMDEFCNKEWKYSYDEHLEETLTFFPNMTCLLHDYYGEYTTYNYIIQGNLIILYSYIEGHGKNRRLVFCYVNGKIFLISEQ